jgi:hypothetical protein
MKRSLFLLCGLGLALTANAAPNAAVRCGANQERVWVYDNLKSFDVGVRLKCGDSVTLVGLDQGYVRVRTNDGYEGYVAVSSLPAEEVAALAPPAAPVSAAMAPAAPAPRAIAVATPVITVTAPAAPASVAVPAAPTLTGPPPPAAVVPVAKAEAPSRTAQLPASVAVVSAPAKPAVSPAPARAPVAQVAAPRPVAATPVVSSAPAAPKENAVLVIEPASTSITITASAAPKPAMLKTADVTPIRQVADLEDEGDDMPDVETAPIEDLSSCNAFFSAYGATPAQIKWFAATRRKQFPRVCPAPEPSMVDYVVIFTHDNNFYTASMPEPVHTDKNGFSDWSPVTPVDDTLVPTTELDKSRHEYAWVFRVRRGSFDPAKFSPRRRPLFTKTEHGSSKAAEDAFEFIAQGGSAP